MEETDPKEDFYRAIADSRAEARAEARARLAGREENGYLIIVDAAERLEEILHGGSSPDSIGPVIASFGNLPLTTEWYGFIEIAGQVVLARGISEKSEGLIDAGLSLMEKARSLGFPLSGHSKDLIRKAAGNNTRAGKILEE